MGYTKFNELREHYLTITDLVKYLGKHGFSVDSQTVKRWEKVGAIPAAKRVLMKGQTWRVYSKDKKDFRLILKTLKSQSKKIISLKGVK